MCGIAGFLGDFGADSPSLLKAMTDAIRHRGPDDEGAWHGAENQVHLGQRRLAIIDLSPLGHQPMRSSSGRFTITFNGEIYNFQELRSELERLGTFFRGTSDTEVMLEAFERWGVVGALTRFNGMFAFAVWDDVERLLWLARDRIGKKPLYYGWTGGAFLFGSELKALRAHRAFASERNDEAVDLFLRYGYIPAPLTIHRDIFTLPPGSAISVSPNSVRERGMPQPTRYWSLEEIASRPLNTGISTHEAQEEIDRLVADATRIRMIADVPLGAFLSGGIDSSLIVAHMARQSSQAVRTFSIGFHEKEYDEAPYARAVAEHLGAVHEDLYVSAEEMWKVVPELPHIADEPFADSSIIPTTIVSRLARKHVTVSLTGDGGDELFIGYNRYTWTGPTWRKVRLLPGAIRRELAQPPARPFIRGCMKSARVWAPRFREFSRVEEATDKLQRVLGVRSDDELYNTLISYWTEEEVHSQLRGHGGKRTREFETRFTGVNDFALRCVYRDLARYLPDDLLAKVDRASMSTSLECRAPLLDYRLIEFACSLPLTLRAPQGRKKALLKDLLARYVPAKLTERPKMGFSVPIGRWLRGPLRPWAESLLTVERIEGELGLSSRVVLSRWQEHLDEKRNWHESIWPMLMLLAWADGARERR